MNVRELIKKLVKGYLRDFYWEIHGKTIKNPCLFIVNGSKNNIFDSAGLHVTQPKPSPENAVVGAKSFGVSLDTHRSKRIDKEMFEMFDVIIAMEVWQFNALKRSSPYEEKIFLLPLFDNPEESNIRGFLRYNIQDPYGKDLVEFHNCFDRIERCVKRMIGEISPHYS